MDNMKMEAMNLVTTILTERIMTLMTQTLTMRARTLLMMTMIPIQIGMLMLVIMIDADKSEDDAINGDTDKENN